MSLPGKQSGMAGIAILTALMLVAIIAAVAVKQSWRSELDLQRASHRWMGMQSAAYIEGAERLALAALQEDAAASQIDTLEEAWAERFEFPTDHGYLAVQIRDAQAKFNVNALGEPFRTQENGQPILGPQKYSETQRRFIRLLQSIEIEESVFLQESEAEALLEAVKDWIDPDSEVSGFGGAERDYYASLDPPLTIGNGPLLSPSELLRIRGMPPALYAALLPHLVALDVEAKLNINTAEAWQLRSFNRPGDLSPLSAEDAEALWQDLRSSVPDSVSTFRASPLLATLVGSNSNGAADFNSDGLTVSSQYFVLDATVLVGDHIDKSQSLIARSRNKSRVVRRSDTGF